MTEGPRLSLKAIAEQAVRAKQEASAESPPLEVNPSAAFGTGSIEPPARLPAPPLLPRDAKPRERATSTASLLLPATLIATLSAALAGGVVWWFVQAAPSSPPAPAPSAASPQAATAAHPPTPPRTTPAAAMSTDPATAVAVPAAPTASAPITTLGELPKVASTPSSRTTAKPQPTQPEHESSVDIAKTIATLGSTQGPVLAESTAGSGPPLAPPGGAQVEPSNLTPSSGAVQAAVGSVLGNARNCVAGDREASRARVVFDSSGAVSGVTVTGPAAGTPAESCIKAALSKARVAPFQKPNYSVDTTIRP